MERRTMRYSHMNKWNKVSQIHVLTVRFRRAGGNSVLEQVWHCFQNVDDYTMV
jgi:hypothetical protein